MAVTGVVRADARAPGGHELHRHRRSRSSAPSPDFPISPKEHGTHVPVRASASVAAQPPAGGHRAGPARGRAGDPGLLLRRRASRWWTRRSSPASIGEEAGNLFATDYFDLGKAYLAQTGQLYVEAAAAALGKVYCFGPTFRAEKSKTRRHLTEFWMVEPEVAWNDSDANMRLQEEFVSYIVARVLERRQDELKELERDTAPLERVRAPFPADYLHRCRGATQRSSGSDIAWGEDLGGDDETLLAKQYDRPRLRLQLPEGRSRRST